MVQIDSVLTAMLIYTVQCLVWGGNILGVKCDEVVDFPKSGHIWQQHPCAAAIGLPNLNCCNYIIVTKRTIIKWPRRKEQGQEK